MTPEQFADRLGIDPSEYKCLELGDTPLADAVAALAREASRTSLGIAPTSRDPIERIIETALIDAGIRYATDQGGGTASRLDFRLLDYGIEIEVKRFHTDRVAAQLARSPEVILVQGERAAKFVAAALRSGDFFPVADLREPEEEKSATPPRNAG
jgi:transcriptional regulator with XRE-family HTH domain